MHIIVNFSFTLSRAIKATALACLTAKIGAVHDNAPRISPYPGALPATNKHNPFYLAFFPPTKQACCHNSAVQLQHSLLQEVPPGGRAGKRKHRPALATRQLIHTTPYIRRAPSRLHLRSQQVSSRATTGLHSSARTLQLWAPLPVYNNHIP